MPSVHKQRKILALAETAAIATGLAASALLALEYMGAGVAACEIGGGCATVRNSAWAEIAGVPTPWWGLAFFATFLLGSLVASPLGRSTDLVSLPRTRLALALCGAGAALFFLGLQAFSIGTFCPLCVAADLSALVLATTVFLQHRHLPASAPGSGLPRFCATVLAAPLAAFALYSLFSAASPSEGLGSADLTASQDGRTTIVEFLDFQCPACRATHEELTRAVADFGAPVRIVRKHIPLPKHAHAMQAARAYCCAEEAGKAEEVADRLFRSQDLSGGKCEELALASGVLAEPFRECMQSDRPDKQIAADMKAANELGVRGLPTLLIGDERFVGVQTSQTLLSSLRRAKESAKSGRIPL